MKQWMIIWNTAKRRVLSHIKVIPVLLIYGSLRKRIAVSRVLGTILAGNPFQRENGVSLRRAGVCCFAISAAALARVVWGLCYYRSLASLLTYNALFVPIFLLGGLLCLVVSALFRQAAELKAENDLTI